MKTIMMNMVRIFKDDQVVVLDKVKRYGWEGLTFPGGKVEDYESFEDSAIREAKEESGLDVSELSFNGMIIWYDYDTEERFVGLLYTAGSFSGELIPINKEGNLFFQNYKEFLSTDGKSDSMDEILSIYNGTYKEIYLYYRNNKIVESRRY